MIVYMVVEEWDGSKVLMSPEELRRKGRCIDCTAQYLTKDNSLRHHSHLCQSCKYATYSAIEERKGRLCE